MHENIQVMQVETCAVCRTSTSSFGAAICPALLQTVPVPLTLASEPVWPAKCDSPSSLARALAVAPVKLPSKTLVVFSASGCASRAPSASDEVLKCNPGPSSWAASPMSTSTKASLALRLATGVPGSLPDSTRTLPGTVPPHHAIWICLALLTVFKYAEAIRVVARVKSCTSSSAASSRSTAHISNGPSTLQKRGMRRHSSSSRAGSQEAQNQSATSAVDAQGPPAAPQYLNLMYWNIFHNFTLKLTSFDFRDILTSYDIMFFAETDMLPGEEDAADVPEGYTLVSLPRKPFLQTYRRGGGVALLIRDNIDFVKSSLSSSDILVIDLGFMWIIGAYIPPTRQHHAGRGGRKLSPLNNYGKLFRCVLKVPRNPSFCYRI
ncbi:hypothetical protein R3P38DRAFT_3213876 [Favolaschia claudopus]|uniref:Endonuclease/exonuclease/phosphatase domain-containing protein n=1 Tax=Favolaschia claudopus TaxID=2862362 RepID=A0AAW0ACL2_9AGAR